MHMINTRSEKHVKCINSSTPYVSNASNRPGHLKKKSCYITLKACRAILGSCKDLKGTYNSSLYAF